MQTSVGIKYGVPELLAYGVPELLANRMFLLDTPTSTQPADIRKTHAITHRIRFIRFPFPSIGRFYWAEVALCAGYGLLH